MRRRWEQSRTPSRAHRLTRSLSRGRARRWERPRWFGWRRARCGSRSREGTPLPRHTDHDRCSEVKLKPDQPPTFIRCRLRAPAVGERVDEVETATGRAGWPVDRGASRVRAAVGHIDTQHTIPDSEPKRDRIDGAAARLAEAVLNQVGDQQSHVEHHLVVLVIVQWQSIHRVASGARRIGRQGQLEGDIVGHTTTATRVECRACMIAKSGWR